MNKNTILLFTLLLFILLFNVFQSKDSRAELTGFIEDFKVEVDDKIIKIEAELIHKDEQIKELEKTLKRKEMMLDELSSKVQVIFLSEPDLTTNYNRSIISGHEKTSNLPALVRSKDNILTK